MAWQTPQPAATLAEQSRRDAHSIVADAMFVDPAKGDFRVKDGSPALKLGFVNFPMDQFGVQKPSAQGDRPHPGNSATRKTQLAGTPAKSRVVKRENTPGRRRFAISRAWAIAPPMACPTSPGSCSWPTFPLTSVAAKAGLQKDDVILACNGQPVRTVLDLQKLRDEAAGRESRPPASPASRSPSTSR